MPIKWFSLLLVGLIATAQAGSFDSWGKYDNIPPPLIVSEFSNGRPICKCYVPTPEPTLAPTAAPTEAPTDAP